MQARAYGVGALGLAGFVVTVDVVASPGERRLSIVGHDRGPLADAARRVTAALARLDLPPCRQLVLVGPPEWRKGHPGLDLAIACAVLASHGIVPSGALDRLIAWSELDGEGRLITSAGTLHAAVTAREHGFRRLALAPSGASSATHVPDLDLLLAPDLRELVAHLRGEKPLPRMRPVEAPASTRPNVVEIDSDSDAALALEVMLAGGHHLLVHTSLPVVGLASTLAALLGELELDDAIELTMVHELVGPGPLLRVPRVRHASQGIAAHDLLGSGSPPRPGEISLAHQGVLMVENLAALQPGCARALADALVEREVRIEGARLPARARVLATCPPDGRVDASLIERFDLVVSHVPAGVRRGAAARISTARDRQRERLAATPWRWNAEIPWTGEALSWLCPAERGCKASTRARRVARTIADLDLERDPAAPIDAETLARARAIMTA